MSAKIQIVLFFYFVFWDKKFLFLHLLMLDYNKSVALTTADHDHEAKTLVESYPSVPLTVDCVIFGFDENSLKVLVIKSDLAQFEEKYSLLGDNVKFNEDLDDAAHRVLLERTGMKDVYLEQVHSFGNPQRHPGGRVVTTVYASLLNVKHHELSIINHELNWHPVDQLKEMAFDHKQILDFCKHWLQKRIQEHPLAFNLLPKKFSLRQLQNVYEAILNCQLDRRNFRKKFASMGYLKDTNEMEVNVTHRPGKLYIFDFEAYQQRKKNGVGIDF
jgi:8-oxo-dGTP diphosphatase